MVKRIVKIFILTALVIGYQESFGQTRCTVMAYNLLNFPGSTPERIDHFQTVIRHLQPDLVLVCELQNESAADNLLAQFNAIWPGKYNRAAYVNGPSTDNMLFYNTSKFALKSQDVVTTSTRWLSHFVVYYRDINLGMTSDTVFLNLFGLHLKASSGSSNETIRSNQVNDLMGYITNSSSGENLIVGGDFNIYSDNEPALLTLISNTTNPLYDPINSIGNWHNNSSYKAIHTQSTRTTSFGGGVPGGMDDRFDLILLSGDLITNVGDVTYVQGSYNNPGNDGNHFDMSIVEGPVNNSVPDSVLHALWQMSDHLPVVLELSADVVLPVREIPFSTPTTASKILYANDGKVYLKFENEMTVNTVNVELVSVDGRSLRQAEFGGNRPAELLEIDTRELPPGLYLLRLDLNGAAAVTHKLIKHP